MEDWSPSVIESPSATTVPTTEASACTSTPVANSQQEIGRVKGWAWGEPVRFELARWLVSRELSCWVAGPVRSGRKTLTASRCSVVTSSGTGSLSASPPWAMSTLRLPGNVTRRSVPGATAAPCPAMATEASPTRSGASPKALESGCARWSRWC